METIDRVHVILGLDRKNYPHLIGRGQDVCSGFEGHPALFVATNPPLPTLKGWVQDLIVAQQAVRNRTPGAAETRVIKANTLVSGLVTAQCYVQGLIDNAPPDQGPLIAKSAGMLVAQRSSFNKPVLRVTQRIPSAPVHLDANVGFLTDGVKGKVYFNWQLSNDGGKTWLSVPSTPHGNTDIDGLTALTTYVFRVSVTSKKGTGTWYENVPFLVR